MENPAYRSDEEKPSINKEPLTKKPVENGEIRFASGLHSTFRRKSSSGVLVPGADAKAADKSHVPLKKESSNGSEGVDTRIGSGPAAADTPFMKHRRKSSNAITGNAGHAGADPRPDGGPPAATAAGMPYAGADEQGKPPGRSSFTRFSLPNENEPNGFPGTDSFSLHMSMDDRDQTSGRPKWDSFMMSEQDHYHASADMWWVNVRKVFRVVTLVFTFLLVLTAAVFSKILLLVICTNTVSNRPGATQIECVCQCERDEPEDGEDAGSPSAADAGEYDYIECLYGNTSRAGNNTAATNRFAEMVTVRWAWSLILVIVFPYVSTAIKCTWNMIGCKTPKWYGCRLLFTVLALEALHTCGVVLLTTRVLPDLDLLEGAAALLGLGVVPSGFKLFSHGRVQEDRRWMHLLVDAFAFLSQISVPALFVIAGRSPQLTDRPHRDWLEDDSIAFYVSLCASFVLVSVRWWPNFINRFTVCCAPLRESANGVNTDELNRKPERPRQKKKSYRSMVRRSNYLLHLIVSLWKIALTVAGVLLSIALKFHPAVTVAAAAETRRSDDDGGRETTSVDGKNGADSRDDSGGGGIDDSLASRLAEFFSMPSLSDLINVSCPGYTGDETPPTPSLVLDYVPYVVFSVQVGCGIVCYFVALHACKVKLQRYGFALPLFLTTPTAVGIVALLRLPAIHESMEQFAASSGILLRLPDFQTGDNHLLSVAALMCATAVWWLAQSRITAHVWFPKVSRISTADRLFLTPMFDAEALEQSLLYSRRNDLDFEKTPEELSSGGRKSHSSQIYLEDFQPTDLDARDPDVHFLYLCATMWHETEDEMKQILKSVYRLDKDQNWRKNAQEYFGVDDPDYYEFEGHIFFDDAFTEYNEGDEHYSANSYVKQLIRVVPIAASAVHKKNVKVADPVRIPTPYGGRLEWRLPGGNLLVAHLKDKMKIRHKKRWSQVMYMYYFLGYRIVASDIYNERQKEVMAKKTYLLALDGDVDFQPEAVHLLVDMMKRNEDVGAACGRIHPIGSGFIVWYQKFEYAVSHWLQKATEHILGCVLCSPGCFSLFRGSALMDDNVMRRYATPSTEASHYLQYDQGEDRWLCTLLLQQGYRVEYNAAADALTNAPEGFNEFYNQRRRWGPSTMANILDLIMDIKHVVKVNRYMSFAYIFYQAVMFFASILGPGTIFLMITGAVALVLKDGDDLAFILNATPIIIYIIISYVTPADFQLKFASLLSAVYALVMGIVMVSVVIEINQNVCSSSAIFFFVVAGTFLLSALLHPQELIDVVYGLVYYLLIPCMYLLLIIYSMVNLNNVSWGTREVKSTTAPAPEVKPVPQRRQSLSNILTSLITRQEIDAKEQGATYSCGNTCRIVCCPRPREHEEDRWFFALNHKLDKVMEKLNQVTTRMYLKSNEDTVFDDDVEASGDNDADESHPLLTSQAEAEKKDTVSAVAKTELEEQVVSEPVVKKLEFTRAVLMESMPRDDLINPHWIEEPDILSGPVQLLNKDETVFWQQLLATYLKPLDNNAAKQKKIAEQLVELRNKVTFGFFLMNAMFVVIIYTLQKQKDAIYVEWPCLANGKTQKERIDPIGLIFLAFFVFVMIVQVVGMIFHRLGTFFHIMAATTLTLCKGLTPDGKRKQEDEDNARTVLELAKHIGSSTDKQASDSTSTSEDGEGAERLRKQKSQLMRRILDSAATEPVVVSLDDDFKEQVEALDNDLDKEDPEQHSSVLTKMPSNRQRSTVHYLREKRTIASARKSKISSPGRVHWNRRRAATGSSSTADGSGGGGGGGVLRCDSISSDTDASSMPRPSIELSTRNMSVLTEEDQSEHNSLTQL